MAYNFSDVTGKEVGDAPCINGLRELKAYIQKEGPHKFPAMADLLQNGYTKLLVQLGIDCRGLAKNAPDKEIKSSILSFGKAAKKAKEILIMED
jgi:hypothetical protein